MASATDQLIDSFASKLKKSGVPVRWEDNTRLSELEARLPKRLPQSFEPLLSRYSFPLRLAEFYSLVRNQQPVNIAPHETVLVDYCVTAMRDVQMS
jgi:hypothetical protein